jgi:hypothetical protein
MSEHFADVRRDRAEYHRGKSKEWYGGVKDSPEYKVAAVERSMRWQENNPEKMECYRVYKAALSQGELVVGLNCEECGVEDGLVGHHEDYSKPLDVIWLCGDCHRKIHRKY